MKHPPVTLINPAQARKHFHDYLDDKRPWANHSSMYDAMEEIVDAAELAFTGNRRPTKQEYHDLEVDVLRITQDLKDHPDSYEGPCACAECRSEMQR